MVFLTYDCWKRSSWVFFFSVALLYDFTFKFFKLTKPSVAPCTRSSCWWSHYSILIVNRGNSSCSKSTDRGTTSDLSELCYSVKSFWECCRLTEEKTKILNDVSRVHPKPREGRTTSSGVKSCTLHLSSGTAPHQDVPVCEGPDVTEVTDGVFSFHFCG